MTSAAPNDAADGLARTLRALTSRIDGELGMLGVDPDIARMADLMDVLGSPQLSYPSVHVAGTNGKTSTTRMVDALLRAFGLRTGRYTSPHLSTVLERIALDGASITAARFVATYGELAPYLGFVDSRHPHPVTYFEAITAMGLAVFADAPVDVGVVEVGLGGRWDATNVIRAGTCVITPISLDHTELLGHSLTSVAGEKAGIIHEGARVVSGVQTLESAEVLVRRAAEVGAELAVEGVHFGVAHRLVAVGGQTLSIAGLAGTYDDLFLPLHGAHQAANAACAVAAVECFLGGASAQLDVEAVRAGLAAADSPGRLEVVRRSPTVLLDGAHNPAGVAALGDALEEAFAFDRLIGVVAILADKDAAAMLAGLETVLHEIVVTTNSSPRALPAEDLAESAIAAFGADRVHTATSLPDALDVALRLADEGGGAGAGVLVTGSLYTVGEARTLLVSST